MIDGVNNNENKTTQYSFLNVIDTSQEMLYLDQHKSLLDCIVVLIDYYLLSFYKTSLFVII